MNIVPKIQTLVYLVGEDGSKMEMHNSWATLNEDQVAGMQNLFVQKAGSVKEQDSSPPAVEGNAAEGNAAAPVEEEPVRAKGTISDLLSFETDGGYEETFDLRIVNNLLAMHKPFPEGEDDVLGGMKKSSGKSPGKNGKSSGKPGNVGKSGRTPKKSTGPGDDSDSDSDDWGAGGGSHVVDNTNVDIMDTVAMESYFVENFNR